MVETAASDERAQIPDPRTCANAGRERNAREFVAQVQLDEIGRCDRLQHSVVRWLEFANQLRLKQSCLQRRSRDARLDSVNMADELCRLGVDRRGEIRPHPLAQAARFADIEQGAARIAHQIYPGRQGQRRDLFGRNVPLDATTGNAAAVQIEQAVEPANSQVFRYFQKDAQNFSRHACIAETAMPSGGRQPEMLRQQIEASSLERWNK